MQLTVSVPQPALPRDGRPVTLDDGGMSVTLCLITPKHELPGLLSQACQLIGWAGGSPSLAEAIEEATTGDANSRNLRHGSSGTANRHAELIEVYGV